MINNSNSISKYVLLTGAGFTHNFGGFLSKAMWSEIHNRYLRYSQKYSESQLCKDLKKEFNYEILYQSVVHENKYTKYERDAFIQAVLDSYETMDMIIRDHKNKTRFTFTRPVHLTHIKNFLLKFTSDGGHKAFYFTLNQDIFVERYLSGAMPKRPGINLINSSRFNDPSKKLESTDYGMVPSPQELEELKMKLKSECGLYYVKLHGSYDWRDESNEKVLVIGTSKTAHIRSIPILSWYFELFRDVLSLPNRKLLIIGYGFQDKHINTVIAEATKKSNLKVYIISPHNPEHFKFKILGINQGWNDDIWRKTSGYYPYTLSDIFPHGEETPIFKSLKHDFFD